MLDIDENINDRSEKTSSILNLSYGIENELYHGSNIDNIKDDIKTYKQKDKFPKNLTFIDAHLDEATGMSAVAFIDEETGKVIVGFTVTNLDTGNIYGVKDDEK